jgi:hypothetical protein
MTVGCDWVDLTINCDIPFKRIESRLVDTETGQCLSSAIFSQGHKIADVEESGSTKILIKPGRVQGEIFVSGNIGRWGKHDNVFQPTVNFCLTNLLPKILVFAGASSFDLSSGRLHRLDICELLAMDKSQSYRYISWASGQSLGRLRPSTEAHGTYWGKRSSHRTVKIYDKLQDLRRRGLTELADKLELEFGSIVRREIQLRRTLGTFNMCKFSDWDEASGALETSILNCQFRQLDNGGVSYEEAVSDIETRQGRAIAGYVSMWRDGVDLARVIPDRSYRRIRAQVREATGIDLSLPPDITRLATKIIEVKPKHLEAPDWYDVSPSLVRLRTV